MKMVKYDGLISAIFAFVSQLPLFYIYLSVKGEILMENVGILLASFILTMLGFSLLGFLLSDHLREILTPKHEAEATLLAILIITGLYFIGFFWLLVEIKAYVVIGETFIWGFITSQVVPIIILLLFVTILSSPE